MTARELLLRIGRKQGPCLICGRSGHLARHRLWDALDSTLRAGESESAVGRWYAVPVAEVRCVREAYAEARRAHRVLPGRAER